MADLRAAAEVAPRTRPLALGHSLSPHPTMKLPMKLPLHSRFSTLLLLLAAACAVPDSSAIDARAPDIRMGEPADVGMSVEGLARIDETMEGMIDEERTGGIMTLVAREGTIVHWEANGWRVLDEDPLEPNDVFRIYSMTKPVTSVAAMILVEEGRLELDQRLSEVIREFGDVQVYDDGALRAPSRPITIRDLLRHTSGLTYGVFGNTAVDQMYVRELNALDASSGQSLEETVDVIASLPLLADPGTLWNYSMSTDVLGRVVEVASGMSLADFFQERIFDPLQMNDTGFWVDPEDADRFVAQYGRSGDGLQEVDGADDSRFLSEPSWFSGGGGLTSTAMDYLRFAQMLLDEGELDGVRILRPETVRDMQANHLDEALMPIRLGGPVADHGFGLGFAVATGGPSQGNYWWAGVANTWFWIDPVEDIIAMAWTQYSPFGGIPINPTLQAIVYESLVESSRMAAAGRN